MLVSYVRDYYGDARPVATIVAIGPDNIGIAICNGKDAFNKKLGRHIAEERAKTQKLTLIPNRVIIDSNYNVVPLCDILNEEYAKMKERAKTYFK